MTYIDFLRSKIEVAPVSGFAVDPEDLSPTLFDYLGIEA